MNPSEEDIEALMSGRAPGDSDVRDVKRIVEEITPQIEALRAEREAAKASLEHVRPALREFEDLSPEALAEGGRREEALRNEREVQERARAYRQVEKGTPTSCPHCGGDLTPTRYEVD